MAMKNTLETLPSGSPLQVVEPSPPLTETRHTLYWWQAIDDAEERGHFTLEQEAFARGWVDCACGRQDPRIPRDANGCPDDWMLQALGVDFSLAVHTNRFDSARKALASIEFRSAEILRELEG